MNKTVLKKIIKYAIFEDLGSPRSYTEIFSNVKYKDYHLRGQNIGFLHPLYAIETHELIAVGYYVFFFN